MHMCHSQSINCSSEHNRLSRLRRQQLQQRGLEERRAKEKAQRQAQQKNDNGVLSDFRGLSGVYSMFLFSVAFKPLNPKPQTIFTVLGFSRLQELLLLPRI